MEEILKYENREKLYQSLIHGYGFIKIKERYDEKSFGNFSILLEGPDFLIRYSNDRSVILIYILAKQDKEGGIDLTFVRDLILYPTEAMNSGELAQLNNQERVKLLNDFLIFNYEKIKILFNEDNYLETKKKINYWLKRSYFRDHPDMVDPYDNV